MIGCPFTFAQIGAQIRNPEKSALICVLILEIYIFPSMGPSILDYRKLLKPDHPF